MKLRIYLAGWAKELEYRKIAKEHCGDNLDLVDPMEITWKEVNGNIGKNCANVYIVRRDKMLIDSCHILVAYIRVGPTFGTVMEIQYAFSKGIPVFVIDPTPEAHGFETDAWYSFHTTKLFTSIEECFNWIMSRNYETTFYK